MRAVVRGPWALVERLIEKLGGDIVTTELKSQGNDDYVCCPLYFFNFVAPLCQ